VVERTDEEACMADRDDETRGSDREDETRGSDREDETPRERAEELAHEAAEENPDPITYREVLEGELDEEGLSEEGREIGEAIE
jgi:hypothetical protein